ncbi:hypothetical protein [Muricoccus radiodurans]|uniref:hypothetical protein n=1 Tax=Muricoccus radiodurans TaxID=2231721 RepID=UPI003CEF3C97
MLRSLAIALGAVMALSAAQPADAARNRSGREEVRRGAAHAPSARSVRVERPSTRRAERVSARRDDRRPAAAPTRGAFRLEPLRLARGEWIREPSSRGRAAAPSRQAMGNYRYADLRRGTRGREVVWADRRLAEQGRGHLRMVGMFSRPAMAGTLPADMRRRAGPKPARFARTEQAYAYERPAVSESFEAPAPRRGVWHAGLPAADGEQTDCPAGTMAVLARGHSSTFRCMPL